MLSAAPRASLTLPSCSPNYPRASRIGWTLARHCPFLKNEVESISLERVRRMPSKRPSSNPRAAILKFSYHEAKECVWSFVKNLKGSGIGNDFQKEIDETHQTLYPVLKERTCPTNNYMVLSPSYLPPSREDGSHSLDTSFVTKNLLVH